MSEAIKKMLADRERANDAFALGLRKELNRRILEAPKARFIASFNRQARFYRVKTNDKLPRLPLETMAICEGADLAVDPGWNAERAWNYSETRQRAVAEVEAEIERRKG